MFSELRKDRYLAKFQNTLFFFVIYPFNAILLSHLLGNNPFPFFYYFLRNISVSSDDHIMVRRVHIPNIS